MAEDDEGFTFGDFVFSTAQPQPQPQPQPQSFPINGGLTSASPDEDDYDWGDVAPPQPILSNGFSHPPQSNPILPINSKPPNNLGIFSTNPPGPASDLAPKIAQKPRGALPLSLFGEVEDEEDKSDSIDSGNKNYSNGLFDPSSRPQNGKIEVKMVSNGGVFHINGDVLANLYVQSQRIKPEIGSGLNSGVSAPDLNNSDDVEEGDDEWEFMGAFPANGHVKGNEEQGASVLSGSKVERGVVVSQEKQAGQDVSSSDEYKHGSSSSLSQFIDLLGASQGAVNKANEINVGLNKSSTAVNTNGLIPDLFNGIRANSAGSGINTTSVNESDDLFSGLHGAIHKSDEMHVGLNNIAIKLDTNGVMPDLFNGIEATVDGSGMVATSVNENGDLFSGHHGAIQNEKHVGLNNIPIKVDTNGFMPDLFHGVEAVGNESGTSVTSVNEDDDFDDFGDFIDVSPEVSPQKQKDQCNPQCTAVQLPNGNIQDQQAQSENSRGPLPLSLFSDGLEESKSTNDNLTQQDEMFNRPISTLGSTFSTQSSGISMHDLLSNLSSQSQPTSSIDSPKNPSENGSRSSPKTEGSPPFGDDDDGDDNSWEFKDASSERGIHEQSTGASPGTVPQQPLETTSNLQFHIDFYVKLKESLCILLSRQLNEEKDSPGTIGHDGKAEAVSHDIKEEYKLLKSNITNEELLFKKHLDRSQCLHEVLEALQGPKYKVIESEYSLSERLQLATNDRRTATELLRHAVSVLQILSLGSAHEQSVYVSSWFNIISVCLQELRHGALIWKRALEKSLQAQALADPRGQCYIQALGEIYKVVELLRLSTTLYKPWMLLSVPDPQQPFGLLEECASLWSSSGLEEALQNMSDNVGPGHDEAAKALITSIKNIRDVDVLAVHDHIFLQQKSICRLSLLPLEMMSDLKVAVWNTEPFFLNLANLWANLISRDPPQLPCLQVR